MKIKLKKIVCALWMAVILSFPLLALVPGSALAQSVVASPADRARCEAFKKKLNDYGANLTEGQPFFCSASELILKVINYALGMAGIITVMFLIVGGFWYITAAGNDEQAEKGKKTITNSIIGLVVIILAYTIVRIVSGTLTSVGK
jgi:hypothetical protein